MRAKRMRAILCSGLLCLCATAGASLAIGAHTGEAIAAPRASQDAGILAASHASPDLFVRALLKMYEDGNVPLDQLPDNRAFFSAQTAALIARLSVANPEGVFSADPFCDCQDWGSLKVSAADTTIADPTHATVRVAMTGDTKLTQLYVLVKEAGGWRVEDIVHPTNGSMLAGLKAL